MHKFYILALVIIGCSPTESNWREVTNASWESSLAFTECNKTLLTATPECKVSFNDLSSNIHSHIIETDINSIKVGENLRISLYKGENKNNFISNDVYRIVSIQKKGNNCRLIINPKKYEDVFLTVGECNAT